MVENCLPDQLKGQPLMIGIDEAGRGPVLGIYFYFLIFKGPMVYTAAFTPISNDPFLKRLGVADSKVLTEAQRESIYQSIKQPSSQSELIGWISKPLHPQFISSSMLQKQKYNLNSLSHDTAISLVSEILSSGFSISSLFVDTVGDCGKYESRLKQIFGNQIEMIRVEKKADSLFPIVSAASIIAKVTRDSLLKGWQFVEGKECLNDSDIPFGSGYPADPQTKRWLNANFDKLFGFPSLIRFSWSTCASMLEAKGHPVQWWEESEGGNEGSGKRKEPESIFNSNKKKSNCFLFNNGIKSTR